MTTRMGAGVVSVDGICCWSATLESTNCLTARLNRYLRYLSFRTRALGIQSQADRILVRSTTIRKICGNLCGKLDLTWW